MSEHTIELIDSECENIKQLLISKNRAYGNSFSDPVGIFSHLSAEEALYVRIDDKLSRLARGKQTDNVPEDTIKDLIGYLILLRVLWKLQAKTI